MLDEARKRPLRGARSEPKAPTQCPEGVVSESRIPFGTRVAVGVLAEAFVMHGHHLARALELLRHVLREHVQQEVDTWRMTASVWIPSE